MVRKCAFPGCPNREKLTSKRKGALTLPQNERLTFHRFPSNDRERLNLWLLAVQRDVNLPINFVKHMKLCSEHFSPDDFKSVQQKRLLKSTAVPNLFIQTNKVRGSSVCSTQVPDSPFPSTLLLVLSSPEKSIQCSKPSTSGTYYALPNEQTYAESENINEDLSLDVSMLSLDPTTEKDLSFVPLSSTSTSTPTTEEEEANCRFKDKKWIVNESSLMELFTRCHHCGASVTETKKTTCGSLIRVAWECSNGHQVKWNSCDEIRGMPANNLLVAATDGSAHLFFSGQAFFQMPQTIGKGLHRRI
uniref:THAP-type domain-containing protein n=2 Tax=Cyprinus carpio TaxID=7962 RepID=A0A8C2EIR4_CYPCA